MATPHRRPKQLKGPATDESPRHLVALALGAAALGAAAIPASAQARPTLHAPAVPHVVGMYLDKAETGLELGPLHVHGLRGRLLRHTRPGQLAGLRPVARLRSPHQYIGTALGLHP